MYHSILPPRVRVLILGGGIHGVGLLHDMASRGWKDIHLLEKGAIGCGTSSKSTKLVHGGLRYLEHLGDFPLVFSALRERALLKKLAPDLVSDLKLYFPIFKTFGVSALKLRMGLSLYDWLAGKSQVHKHRQSTIDKFAQDVPHFNNDLIRTAFSYYDMQTDDLRLVHRVAASAWQLGGKISEGCEAISIKPDNEGWIVTVRDEKGATHTISALYVFNALGPWANHFLETSNIEPPMRGVNSKGAHIILPDQGLRAGLFLQSPKDKRLFFAVPWLGYTLVGTTETLFREHPDSVACNDEDVDYLLESYNYFFQKAAKASDILVAFAGLRWLAQASGRDLNNLSRHDTVAQTTHSRGQIFTLYGGKLTTYRHLCEKLGDTITRGFGEYTPSQTANPSSWLTKANEEISILGTRTSLDPITRFQKSGVAFSDKRNTKVSVS